MRAAPPGDGERLRAPTPYGDRVPPNGRLERSDRGRRRRNDRHEVHDDDDEQGCAVAEAEIERDQDAPEGDREDEPRGYGRDERRNGKSRAVQSLEPLDEVDRGRIRSLPGHTGKPRQRPKQKCDGPRAIAEYHDDQRDEQDDEQDREDRGALDPCHIG